MTQTQKQWVFVGGYSTTIETFAFDPATGAERWKNEELKLDHQVGPGGSPVVYLRRAVGTMTGGNHPSRFARRAKRRSSNDATVAQPQ